MKKSIILFLVIIDHEKNSSQRMNIKIRLDLTVITIFIASHLKEKKKTSSENNYLQGTSVKYSTYKKALQHLQH